MDGQKVREEVWYEIEYQQPGDDWCPSPGQWGDSDHAREEADRRRTGGKIGYRVVRVTKRTEEVVIGEEHACPGEGKCPECYAELGRDRG